MNANQKLRVLKYSEILENLASIATLDQQNMSYFWSLKQWNEFVRGEKNIRLTIASNQESIFSFSLWQLADPDCAHLLKIVTSSLHRGVGFGKNLIRHDIDQLRKLDFKNFYLEVAQSNTAAISLYEEVGFQKIHLKKQFYSDGSSAYAMQLSLN